MTIECLNAAFACLLLVLVSDSNFLASSLHAKKKVTLANVWTDPDGKASCSVFLTSHTDAVLARDSIAATSTLSLGMADHAANASLSNRHVHRLA